MKKILLALLFVMSPVSFAHANDLPISNAGFVPANIWYSKDPFFAGDSVRVYTIIFNGSTYDLTGGVEFLNNGVVIGSTSFSLSGNGRVQDVWVDWTATQGAHTITARLINVIADGPNGKQPVSLDSSETGKSVRVVAVDPAVAAAKAKAQTEEQVQKVADAGVQAVNGVQDTVKGVISNVSEAIPTPVKNTVSTSVVAIESFRIGVADQLQVAKENKAKEIDAMNAITSVATSPKIKVSSGGVIKNNSTTTTQSSSSKTDSNTMQKPFAYVALAVYTGMQYFFQWQILFYGVLLYVLYRLLKWGIGKIRNRE